MSKQILGGSTNVCVEIEYLANKNITEDEDIQSDEIFVECVIEGTMEECLIEGHRHYSYSRLHIIKESLEDIKKEVDNFISENGYTLIDYSFTDDFDSEDID